MIVFIRLRDKLSYGVIDYDNTMKMKFFQECVVPTGKV